jgi:hypothetical protein
MPGAEGGAVSPKDEAPAATAEPEKAEGTRNELDALREQMLAMQKKLDSLGK